MNHPIRTYRNRASRGTGARRRWRKSKLLLLVGAIGTAGWFFLHQKVHEEICSQVQASFDSRLAHTNLRIEVGSAQFVAGKGLRLNNVAFKLKNEPSQSANAQPAVEIYEAFIHAPVSITELVSCELQPQAVEIQRAKIHLRQQVDGQWNIARIVEALKAMKTCAPQEFVPVSLADCRIDVESPIAGGLPLKLTDVELDVVPIEHDGRPLLQMEGQFDGSQFGLTEFSAYLDMTRRTWTTAFNTGQIGLSKNLLGLLPADVRSSFGRLPEIAGFLSLSGSASGELKSGVEPAFQLNGKLLDFSCSDQRLPNPIRSTNLEFSVDNQQFQIKNAVGKLGEGSFRVSYRQTGLLQRHRWSAAGFVQHFDFTEHQKLSRWFPPYFAKFCREYSPAGHANLQFNLRHDGATLSRNIVGELTNMSFSYANLPYRINHCAGKVQLLNDVCKFDVRSQEDQQIVDIAGTAKNPGPNVTYEITVTVPGELPIDGKMHTAMRAQPRMAKIVSNFNPTGRVGGIGRFQKLVPQGQVNKSFDIRLKQCNVLHNSFNYPIHNVSGLIKVRNGKYTFTELNGSNQSGQINCNGQWDANSGLDLRFICKSVPLDDQLKFALRPELREIWQGFQPRGTLDLLVVDLGLPIDATDCNVKLTANMAKPANDGSANFVSINPTWFPYEIKRLSGIVTIGDGKIELKDMHGHHNRAWIVCEGDGHYADDSWSVKLKNAIMGSLQIDDDLLAALPSSLAPPVRQLDYKGLLTAQGEITIAGQHSPPSTSLAAGYQPAASDNSSSLAWDVGFFMNQAKMKVGLPLENVSGKVHLIGHWDGYEAECRGDVNIDSLTIYDAQITNVKGPIWLDNNRTAAGIFSIPQNFARPAGNFSPVTNQQPVAPSLTGNMHGGVVKFDAQMSNGPTGEFYLQTTLADGNLEQFCREYAPSLSEVSGRSFAALKLKGDCRSTQSYQGEGTIQLRDAKIYELPVILSLLKILKVRQVTRTAFDSSNVDFKVVGDTINFERIELLGDAISLIGNGKMNLDRDINLNFYSVMGRNRINIPLISELYHASSQRILWINVDGTLDNPRTHRNVLPQINDSLRQLFQSNNAARNWNRHSTTPQIGNLPTNQINQ